MEHKLLSEILQKIKNDIVELRLSVSFDVEGVFQYKKTPIDFNHSVKMDDNEVEEFMEIRLDNLIEDGLDKNKDVYGYRWSSKGLALIKKEDSVYLIQQHLDTFGDCNFDEFCDDFSHGFDDDNFIYTAKEFFDEHDFVEIETLNFRGKEELSWVSWNMLQSQEYQLFIDKKSTFFSEKPDENKNLRIKVNKWMTEREIAEDEYGHISNWDTSKVTDMSGLFSNWPKFNDDINNWDVSNVESMEEMFSFSMKFNQPLNKWNTKKVTNMAGMFQSVPYFEDPFNQDISMWDVSSVKDMSRMFKSTSNFNQNLKNWDISSVVSMVDIDDGSKYFKVPESWKN